MAAESMNTNVDRTGTAHYTSAWAARKAYLGDYVVALKEGRIAIGPPKYPEGSWLTTDAAGRYFICSYPATRKEP